MDLTRQTNESEYDYHKRLIFGKLIDKTLSDLDFSELSEYVYGKTYSSDVARRMMYGSKNTLQLLEKYSLSNLSDSTLLSEIDAKMLELKKERQKFFDQRREFNKLISENARKEHLEEQLVRAANDLKNTIGSIYKNKHCNSAAATSSSDTNINNTEAILVLSDWHYGLITDNIFNVYNTSICKDRVKTVIEQVAERILLHSCTRLHIVVLGDLIHGAIHNSARVMSEELACDQLMQVSEILAQSVEYLSNFVPETFVYMTYGNHARTIQNKNDSVHRDNMERIIPWWLAQRFANEQNITIISDTGHEFIFINSCGHDFCASHGDNDSVKSSPRLLSTLFQKKYNKNIEYILLGDKHHRESFNELGVTAMLCGSLCGSDDYANNKRLYSTPSQLLLITNPRLGVDAEYRISC